MGIIASARNASKELPQPSPSVRNNVGAAKGITPAIIERVTVMAARPEAAYKVKASMTYDWIAICISG